MELAQTEEADSLAELADLGVLAALKGVIEPADRIFELMHYEVAECDVVCTFEVFCVYFQT